MVDLISINMSSEMQELALNNFRQYLRIPSVHPDVNYDECVTFLKQQANSLHLECKVFTLVPKKPIVLITWIGSHPEKPAILLNSHMDVVPVFPELWTRKPFEATMDADGKIYGRGTQDMKSVAIQYLEAVRKLKLMDWKPQRTLHLCFVPDEEIGGVDGMKTFAKSQHFQALNIGFALDEGIASPDDSFCVFNGERAIWHLAFHCEGQAGHGSLLLDDTAGEKVRVILDNLFDLRAKEKQKLATNPNLTIGDVLTLNVCILSGGKQSNVVPPDFTIVVDCRIPITMDTNELYKTFQRWCALAGPNVTIEKEQFEGVIKPTDLSEKNQFWVAFKQATDAMKLQLKPMIFPGGTDSRYVRELGIPAIGFSPINNTPVLLHDHDEFLHKDVFLRGIDIYCKIITALSNS